MCMCNEMSLSLDTPIIEVYAYYLCIRLLTTYTSISMYSLSLTSADH